MNQYAAAIITKKPAKKKVIIGLYITLQEKINMPFRFERCAFLSIQSEKLPEHALRPGSLPPEWRKANYWFQNQL
jgi:hypothetical protein